MIGRTVWSARSVSERTAILIGVAGCAYIGWIAFAGDGPVDTGEEFTTYLAALCLLLQAAAA